MALLDLLRANAVTSSDAEFLLEPMPPVTDLNDSASLSAASLLGQTQATFDEHETKVPSTEAFKPLRGER